VPNGLLNTHAHKPATGHSSNGHSYMVLQGDPGTHKLITTNTSTCKISTRTGRMTRPAPISLDYTQATSTCMSLTNPSMQITTPHAKTPLDSALSKPKCTSSLTKSRTHLTQLTQIVTTRLCLTAGAWNPEVLMIRFSCEFKFLRDC
jgi:hypothetical protein